METWIGRRPKSRKTATRKRVYLVPLPPLAVRVLKPLLKNKTGNDLIFPGRHHGKPMDAGGPFMVKVRKASGIEDWYPHAHRHTITTWIQNEGASEFERGLILNHVSTTVTAGYGHGYPTELKRELLEKWADHVAGLVQPDGAVLLS